MSTIAPRRMTRSAARAAAAANAENAPIMQAPIDAAPIKATTNKRSNNKAVLADVTNAAPMVPAVKKPTQCGLTMDWDIDALTAEADVPQPIAAAPQVTIAPTTVVPAMPQLLCAQIDPAITALKVVREPLPSFAQMTQHTANAYDEEEEEEDVLPSSRRVQLLYSDNGDLIGTQDVAPLTHSIDEYDQDECDDFSNLGEVDRMPASEEAVESLYRISAPLTCSTTGYSSGFLPAGLIDAAAVRSVKLEAFDSSEPLPAYLFAAPAPTTQTNQAKLTGFLHTIDANKVASKKL